MKLYSTFEEMELVLNELNEQFETIKKNEVRVPQIEIDIIMATMRRLYESLNRLNKQKIETEVEKPKEIKQVLVETIAKPEPILVIEELIQEVIKVETEEEIKEEPVLFNEELTYENVTNDFQEEIDSLEESAQQEFEASIEEESKFEAEIINAGAIEPKPQTTKVDKPKSSLLLQFEDEIFSVNDSAAQKAEDKSIVKKLSNTRIENLKSAIGINDKFYFINELFSGNSQAYEDVIYTLNNFKRFEDAMQYFSTLKYRYEWNTKADAYHKLVHFLERKFVEVNA